ncbi:unnamed protein product [Cuscuta campestris]|uniref:Tf2-1-like SH3-like domain-containing protein n=1 Tax=Cuscuta campestris TaxID=132261 RepID=A0A484M174_9ASTE|nr:unnamed protein product [Cuscuta campestris]
MRAAADKHRREVHFEVGDLVLLKLQPYRQHSVVTRRSQKLTRRYYGPFRVTAKVWSAAYRLQLPNGSRIHPVFHVSLLKPFRGDASRISPLPLPGEFRHGDPVSRPIRIHAQRRVLVGGATEVQGLVEWSDGDNDDATWEPLDKLRQFYPDLHLEDKVVIEQGESVTTESQGEVHGKPGTQAPKQDNVGAHPCKELRRGSRERRPPAWRKDYET